MISYKFNVSLIILTLMFSQALLAGGISCKVIAVKKLGKKHYRSGMTTYQTVKGHTERSVDIYFDQDGTCPQKLLGYEVIITENKSQDAAIELRVGQQYRSVKLVNGELSENFSIYKKVESDSNSHRRSRVYSNSNYEKYKYDFNISCSVF